MKKILGLSCLILSLFFYISCSNDNTYGNNQTQILNSLKKSNLLNTLAKDNISLIDTISIENSKIVGFSTDTSNGVAVYEKNKLGNYILSEATTNADNINLGASTYRISYKNQQDSKNNEYGYAVISNGVNVAHVEIIINDKYKYSKKLELKKPSLILIKEELPDSEKKEMKVDIKYYDINNKQIIKTNKQTKI